MSSSCDVCVVRNRAVCSTLPDVELLALNRMGRQQSLGRGQTLMWEGDEALLVANVLEGVLKLSTSTSDGREQIVGLVYPSDFIGRPFGDQSKHSVTALTDARVCVFTRQAFDSFARRHPELEHRLLEHTLNELDRARTWMLLLGRKTAGERVASLLLEMSNRLVEESCEGRAAPLNRFELPLTRQQMADVLGLTIETVSRQLTKLKKEGVVALPSLKRIEILDRKRLETMAESSS